MVLVRGLGVRGILPGGRIHQRPRMRDGLVLLLRGLLKRLISRGGLWGQRIRGGVVVMMVMSCGVISGGKGRIHREGMRPRVHSLWRKVEADSVLSVELGEAVLAEGREVIHG